MEWLVRLVGEDMCRKKTTEDTDVRFKDLRFRVHVEGYPLDHLLDGILEPSLIVENHKRIE